MSRTSKNARLPLFVATVLAAGLIATTASAHPDEGVTDAGPITEDHGDDLHAPSDPSAPLIAQDSTSDDLISSGPSAKVTKNLSLRGRGERLDAGATTDVWAYDGYAYTGTFSDPCGGDPEAGIWIWDSSNKNKVKPVGIIPSPVGSRSNDVKVAGLNSGTILVHSNEPCEGGPGGFQIYNVDDPTNPVSLGRVQTDELNEVTPFFFAPGALEDNGVHNLWLFSRGANDYVAAQVEGVFDNFQIFDITDPNAPTLVSGWGAEELFDPGVGDTTLATDPTGDRTLDAVLWLLDGYGSSANRFLHDFTITPDGNTAYLANWDAGLIKLDISDLANPQVVSVALDPTSEDGEVNSHSVWPNEDGSIVVEGEEDFSPFESVFSITSGPAAGSYPAAEGAITVPIFTLPGQQMAGGTTYVGLACSTLPAGSGIALIQRGGCSFSSKINNAATANYSGVVVMNSAANGDTLVSMGGTDTPLPGVFVGHSTGLGIAGVATADDLVVEAKGESVSAQAIPNGWSGLRVWDYSDPANPVLASTFNTVCSANPVDPSCDPAGTYSSHNVVVETTGNKVLAYVSWYTDGILIVDVTDPYNPVEVARFLDDSTNGGEPNDFWGIYKEKGSPWIYGSDRNGGLYILKAQGAGSGK